MLWIPVLHTMLVYLAKAIGMTYILSIQKYSGPTNWSILSRHYSLCFVQPISLLSLGCHYNTEDISACVEIQLRNTFLVDFRLTRTRRHFLTFADSDLESRKTRRSWPTTKKVPPQRSSKKRRTENNTIRRLSTIQTRKKMAKKNKRKNW